MSDASFREIKETLINLFSDELHPNELSGWCQIRFESVWRSNVGPYIIDHNVRVARDDKNWQTQLQAICWMLNNANEVVCLSYAKMIGTRGADVDLTTPAVPLTPLHLSEQHKVILYLLDYGASPSLAID